MSFMSKTLIPLHYIRMGIMICCTRWGIDSDYVFSLINSSATDKRMKRTSVKQTIRNVAISVANANVTGCGDSEPGRPGG
jgi:hypothetical protein